MVREMVDPGEHDALLNGVRIHYTVAGSGHFTFVEEPDKLKALVRDFILE